MPPYSGAILNFLGVKGALFYYVTGRDISYKGRFGAKRRDIGPENESVFGTLIYEFQFVVLTTPRQPIDTRNFSM